MTLRTTHCFALLAILVLTTSATKAKASVLPFLTGGNKASATLYSVHRFHRRLEAIIDGSLRDKTCDLSDGHISEAVFEGREAMHRECDVMQLSEISHEKDFEDGCAS